MGPAANSKAGKCESEFRRGLWYRIFRVVKGARWVGGRAMPEDPRSQVQADARGRSGVGPCSSVKGARHNAGS